ncbi:Ms4533A family Cys-rich leader peptide [Streptomyces sp. NPDC088923]
MSNARIAPQYAFELVLIGVTALCVADIVCL